MGTGYPQYNDIGMTAIQHQFFGLIAEGDFRLAYHGMRRAPERVLLYRCHFGFLVLSRRERLLSERLKLLHV